MGGHFLNSPEVQSAFLCLVLTEPHRGQWRNCKNDRRYAYVIWRLMIPFQQVRRDNRTLVAGHRRQSWASTRGSVSCGINSRIRYALHEFINPYAPYFMFDTGTAQVHVIEFGFAARRMDHHVCLKRTLLARTHSPNGKLARTPFNSFRLCLQLNVNAKLASSLYNLVDQIGVKVRKGAHAPVHDCDLRSHIRRHMGKFKCYISASDK